MVSSPLRKFILHNLFLTFKQMTRQILITIASILALCNCGQRKTDNGNVRTTQVENSIDTSLIVILPYETSLFWICKDCKQAELTSQDLEDVEILLKKCIDEYNLGQEKQFNEIKSKYPEQKFDIKYFTIDLKRYKRQYFATTNKKGDKEVWINCLCDINSWNQDWKKELLIVKDGGNCYFNLIINLSKQKYSELSVNGEA
jgi:hypothetical protein